jgi:aspartyl-tRNA(Asn)/glutamyl-tRNA(Gln) amidotransferase subunit A
MGRKVIDVQLLAAARQHNWLVRTVAVDRCTPSSAGPLASVPYFAKDLFDVAGSVTTAGSTALACRAAAASDAALIRQLANSGAQLCGTTNMDPLAYGFVTNNPHFGRAHNPFDPERICGGSSGGSAAVVAAGLVPFALGSDTSGSIRVPAAFCGVYGYKPSAGWLDAGGMQQLSPTLDRPGLLARDAAMLARVFDVLTRKDRVRDGAGLRVALLGGYFRNGCDRDVLDAVDGFARKVGARAVLDVPWAGAARGAAYVLVAEEAAQTHRAQLTVQPEAFDDQTRHRLAAAALVPPAWVQRARAVQQAATREFATLFAEHDLLLAPAAPCVAPLAHKLDEAGPGGGPPLRASLGVYTQPISLVGAPVVAVPLPTQSGLPTAVQIIARPDADSRLMAWVAEIAASLQPAAKLHSQMRGHLS